MIVDILVLIVLLISAFIAFLRGFIREVLTIAGVAGGLAASYFGGPVLKPLMRGWLGVQEAGSTAADKAERLFGVLPYDVVSDALSYGAIFLVVVIVLSIISHFLAEGVHSLGLGAIDRTLGFMFGLARGILILGLLYLPVHFFIDKDTKEAWFSKSKTHFYLEQISEVLAGFIPSSAIEGAEKGVEDIQGLSDTRKRLEDINLLKKEGAAPAPVGEKPQGTPSPADPKQGYTEDFRKNMDQLFEEKAKDPVTTPETRQNP